MSTAKLTDAERNVMASFWHDGLDGPNSGKPEFWMISLWQLDHGVEDSEFFAMMSVMAKELEAEGKNEVGRPVYPLEIPWADAGEFRRRLWELLSDDPRRTG
jgi:hypothetical protein